MKITCQALIHSMCRCCVSAPILATNMRRAERNLAAVPDGALRWRHRALALLYGGFGRPPDRRLSIVTR
jgi:hypothetical protein